MATSVTYILKSGVVDANGEQLSDEALRNLLRSDPVAFTLVHLNLKEDTKHQDAAREVLSVITDYSGLDNEFHELSYDDQEELTNRIAEIIRRETTG